MKYFYGSYNDKDYTVEFCKKLKEELKIDVVICDFDPGQDFCVRLAEANIISFLRFKLYERPSLDDVEQYCIMAKKMFFRGVAIDLENYKGDDLYSNAAESFSYGNDIGRIISKYFKEVVIYPEYLGMGDKYENYNYFISGLASYPYDITVLFERTYNVVEPWNLAYIYNRNARYMQNIRRDIKCVIGIWPQSLNTIQKIIQLITIKFAYKDVFLYTEGTDILDDKIIKLLV